MGKNIEFPKNKVAAEEPEPQDTPAAVPSVSFRADNADHFRQLIHLSHTFDDAALRATVREWELWRADRNLA